MPQPVNSNNKPMTQIIDAQIPDGPPVWIAGFGKRDSSWRNHTNALPVEQTPSSDDDVIDIDVPVFRNTTGNDYVGTLKKGRNRA